jgi:hypothetical protein
MAERHHCAWLDAVDGTIYAQMFYRSQAAREKLDVAIGNLFIMCRADFAVNRAFQRLHASLQDTSIVGTLTGGADAHALLVSAHLAWRTLEELGKRLRRGSLPYKDLHKALRKHREVRARCKLGRDHFEHVTDHLRLGRAVHHGGKMTAKTFRQAVGAMVGTSVTFGNETFDLAEQVAALADVRATVAPVLAAFATPSGRVVVTP